MVICFLIDDFFLSASIKFLDIYYIVYPSSMLDPNISPSIFLRGLNFFTLPFISKRPTVFAAIRFPCL